MQGLTSTNTGGTNTPLSTCFLVVFGVKGLLRNCCKSISKSETAIWISIRPFGRSFMKSGQKMWPQANCNCEANHKGYPFFTTNSYLPWYFSVQDNLPSCIASGCLLPQCKVSTILVHPFRRSLRKTWKDGQGDFKYPSQYLVCRECNYWDLSEVMLDKDWSQMVDGNIMISVQWTAQNQLDMYVVD